MLYTTKAIALHSVKYSDNSLIVTMLTKQFGRMAYVFRKSKKGTGGNRAACLQPLNLLEVTAYHNPKKNIQHLKEISIATPYSNIHTNAEKMAIAMFISEIINKSLRQTEKDENLFEFIENALICLDNKKKNIANYHLIFLMKLTKFLGFEPSPNDLNYSYFDQISGEFAAKNPQHDHFLEKEAVTNFNSLINKDFEQITELHFNRKTRNATLENLLDFYRVHLPDFPQIKSVEVLKEVFD
ncbi:MAG: DNA repair protein RecO [Prevotellaceae bacterium]|jgi:DNA repair protein RecO (recombination protein O)|nr:DNA repair protein RecO [Prevotellaceae bacterium]